MALYLDIDLDYFVAPIMKESFLNHRPLKGENFSYADPFKLFNILKARGIALGQKRFMFSNHMQSHLRWWLNKSTDNVIIHIDAHSDLYGNSKPDLITLKQLGCQNYLWHSIREDLVSELYWVFPDGSIDLDTLRYLVKSLLLNRWEKFLLKTTHCI
ncbi:hypothetical protein N752_27710 [Desulforamulus aquiferis]|nr:hypothetical protein [Desulforamulus aquiferis]RYD01915.1 hypothetical protein N752_27710 [Desulforamulus aquiferis]